MTGAVINVIRQVRLDPDTLEKIADALQIPQNQRNRIISGEIVIAPEPAPPGGGNPPNPPGGGNPPTPPSGDAAPPTTARGRRRQE